MFWCLFRVATVWQLALFCFLVTFFSSGQHFCGPYPGSLSSVMLWMQSSCISVVVFSLFSILILLCCAMLRHEGVETGPKNFWSFLGPGVMQIGWTGYFPVRFVARSLCLVFWVDGNRMSIFCCCYCLFFPFFLSSSVFIYHPVWPPSFVILRVDSNWPGVFVVHFVSHLTTVLCNVECG